MTTVAELIQREMLTVDDLCGLYNISRRTYENWMKSPSPPPWFAVGNKRFFLRTELLKWKRPKDAAR